MSPSLFLSPSSVSLSQPAMPPVADKPVSQKKSDTIDLFDEGGGDDEEDNPFGAPPNKVTTLTLSISIPLFKYKMQAFYPLILL